MTSRWKLVIDDHVLDTLLGARASLRAKFLQLLKRLASDPYQRPDFTKSFRR